MIFLLLIVNLLLVLSCAHPHTLTKTEIDAFDVEEIKKYLHFLTTNITDNVLPRCERNDDGWFYFNNGYKYKKTALQRNWSDSRITCGLWGGDLVVHGIQDMATRRCIIEALQIINNKVWIGLYDANEIGWFWVNGERAIPSAILWLPGEPSNTNGVEDCAEILTTSENGMGTNDIPCDIERYALCEKEIVVDKK